MGSIASTLCSSKEKLRNCVRAMDSKHEEEEDDEQDLPSDPADFLDPVSYEKDSLVHDREIYDGPDRISNLSDCVLVQILSFIPTKDAVRTSVLSKRWVHLWKFISNLHIHDKSFFYPQKDIFFYDFRKLEKFVDAILPQLQSPSIHSLFFSCWYSYSSGIVHSLISSTLDRNLRKLDISFFLKGFVFPLRVFKCSTLVELKLMTRDCVLNVSTPIHNPNLQILRLSGVVFAESPVALFDFPVLKVFKLKACTWSSVQDVRISTPLVETFSLKHCVADQDDSMCSIEVCAPSVSKLTLVTSQLVQFFPPPDPYSVHSASIGLQMMASSSSWQLCDQLYLRACRLAEQLNGVRYLKLQMDTTRVLCYGGDIAASLPTFDGLVHLEIATSETKFGDLLNILHKSLCLEFLVCRTSCIRVDKNVLVSSELPKCLVTHLKRVMLKAFNGEEAEFRLAKYVLKNAKVLQQLTITVMPNLWQSENGVEKVEEQLQSAKGSSHVKISFFKHETRKGRSSKKEKEKLSVSPF